MLYSLLRKYTAKALAISYALANVSDLLRTIYVFAWTQKMVRQNEDVEASPTRILCNCWPAESTSDSQARTTNYMAVCSSLWKNRVTVEGHQKNIMNATEALTDNFQLLLPVPRKQELVMCSYT